MASDQSIAKRAMAICERALELEDDRRRAYLDEACGEDAQLRANVDSILGAIGDAGDFLQTIAPTEISDAAQLETEISGPAEAVARRAVGDKPEQIGPYRVIRVLGQGGMGVVYEAEQEEPKRRVALKVVRSQRFVDDLFVSMFRREADALARLKHPAIASIYSSGRTDDGQHYFAMELVAGETLDHYLERSVRQEGRAALRTRLALVRQICDAVHYAHQRGVIHRDLKPSNIIVVEDSENEGVPKVKILDFGLARITDTDMSASSLVSEIGVIKGTLPYMSPEQARGNPDEIDVRTDVYALGVMLYEIVAGRRPYRTEDQSLVEAVRVICEEKPQPLAGTLSGAVRIDRDIATIAAKALEKEPERRYGSAAELAGDLGRYLESQPILARPPSAAYQIRKLVERNKIPSALVAVLLTAIVVFGALMTHLFNRSEANLERALVAETEASREAETARQVSGFLEELFRESNPTQSTNSKVTVREMLDVGAAQVEDELAERPEVQSRLMLVMGKAYRELGYYDAATPLLEGALARYVELDDRERAREIELRMELALHYVFAGNFRAAEPIHRDVVAMRRARPDEDPRLLANAINDLVFGLLRSHQFTQEAYELQQEAAQIHRDFYQGHPVETSSNVLMNLGWISRFMGTTDEAIAVLNESLEMKRALHTGDHPSLTWVLQHLGWALLDARAYEEAREHFRESLEMNRRIFAGVHPEISYNLGGMAKAELGMGNDARAVELQREAVEAIRAAVGESHPETFTAREQVAQLCLSLQRLECARDGYVEMIAELREFHGDEVIRLIPFENNRGGVHWFRGEIELAERGYREAFRLAELHQQRGGRLEIPRFNIARVLIRRDRLDEAQRWIEALFDTNEPGALSAEMWGHAHMVQGELLTRRGQFDAAIAAFDRAEMSFGSGRLSEPWRLGENSTLRAVAEAGRGDRELAAASFEQGLARLEALPPGHIERIYGLERAIAALPALAERWRGDLDAERLRLAENRDR